MKALYPKILISTGEPAGIGPDVSLAAAFHELPAEVILLGDEVLLKQRAKQLNLDIHFYTFGAQQAAEDRINGHGSLALYPIALQAECKPGTLEPHNAQYVLNLLNEASTLCLERVAQALVTAPVHKALICRSGVPFSGHTEYLGQLCNSPTMMVFHAPDCLLGLVTTHMPLQTVSQAITAEKLRAAIVQFANGLKQHFNKPHPKIGILGLNPHAGESGTLGDEEQSLFNPVIQELRALGLNLSDPLPADTAFIQKNRSQYDGLLAMYHDQGLTPMKALYFEHLVNVTFGLPFLRTSVDHGTALDLAGTGLANPKSLMKALHLTYHLIK